MGTWASGTLSDSSYCHSDSHTYICTHKRDSLTQERVRKKINKKVEKITLIVYGAWLKTADQQTIHLQMSIFILLPLYFPMLFPLQIT